jgi:hypothetical protein
MSGIEFPILEIPEMPTERMPEDEFLLSQLPMTSSPLALIEILLKPNEYGTDDQLRSAHDKVLYRLGDELNGTSISTLKMHFNAKPIIEKLKSDIIENPRKSMGYGQVVRWIQDNTTTVPTPLSWEVKNEQFVNNLIEWICFFDDRFTWDRPNYTQVIYYEGE